MNIHPAQQGSGEWLAARSTRLTASNLSKVLTPAKLEYSKQADSLALVVAAARVFGVYEDSVSTFYTERGLELEEEAREAYSFLTGKKVRQIGLCITDDELFGASPDGLTGEGDDLEVLEIKCPSLAVHLSYLMAATVPTEYRLQVQGEMYATGAKEADFFSYYPGLPTLLVKVYPDPRVQEAIALAVPKFEALVLEYVAKFEALK